MGKTEQKALRDDDPIHDGDDGGSGGDSTAGPWGVALFGVLVIYLVIASIVGYAMSNNNTPTVASPTCTSVCYGFVKLECPTKRFMGGCFDVPWCSGTPHVCGKDQ